MFTILDSSLMERYKYYGNWWNNSNATYAPNNATIGIYRHNQSAGLSSYNKDHNKRFNYFIYSSLNRNPFAEGEDNNVSNPVAAAWKCHQPSKKSQNNGAQSRQYYIITSRNGSTMTFHLFIWEIIQTA